MKLREQKKAETSARLMAAARKSFLEQGYARTSMHDLCAAAGVTRGALYHNFGGKEGVFEAVVRQIDGEMGDRLLKIADDDTSLKGFIATCIAYLEMALDPEVQQIVFRDGPAVLGQRLREIDQEASLEPLRQAIVELQENGELRAIDPMALAVMINGAMIDAALWIAADEKDEERFTASSRALTDIVNGLAV